MKTSLSLRPRLACQLARSCVTSFGDGSGQGLGSRHVSTCPDCQEFFAICDDLDSALRRDAAPFHAEPDVGFDQRILRAVRMSEPEPAPEPSYKRAAWLSFAGVAASAALAVVLFYRQSPENKTSTLAANSTSSTVADVMVAAESISGRLWSSLKPSADAFSEKNPLEHELDSVYSDARSALGFLALNFFPTEMSRATAEPETSGSSQRG